MANSKKKSKMGINPLEGKEKTNAKDADMNDSVDSETKDKKGGSQDTGSSSEKIKAAFYLTPRSVAILDKIRTGFKVDTGKKVSQSQLANEAIDLLADKYSQYIEAEYIK